MKKLLSCASFAALALCLTPHVSYAMEDSEVEQNSTIQRVKNVQAVANYLGSDINPKVALYGEGDAHTKESNYTPFLTIDMDPQSCPKVHADITNLEDMAVIPSGQLDLVELRNIPTPVFSRKPGITFGDISRVLKEGGTLKFNDMWGGQDASSLKSRFLQGNAQLKESNSEVYARFEAMPAKKLVKAFRDRGQLNPFDQYLEQSDYAECKGKKVTETSLWVAYTEQLSTFFEKVGFTNLTYHTEGYSFWTVRKK
ncbi:MAG: hypothetical protein K2P93_03595 [Alphaproteobacteria bacterium]|nr:hypothetical protein [Alphaproteobacteria bacterium]